MRKKYSSKTKIAAIAALKSGETCAAVCKRFKIKSMSQLYSWRDQSAAGLLQPKPSKAKDTPDAVKGKTPEAVFDDRVREAIILLRHAEDEVERLKQQRKIKEADSAHLYAGLALRILQGDNGR